MAIPSTINPWAINSIVDFGRELQILNQFPTNGIAGGRVDYRYYTGASFGFFGIFP